MKFIDKTKLDLAILNGKEFASEDQVSRSAEMLHLVEKTNEILPARVYAVKKSPEYKQSQYLSQFSAGLELIEKNFKLGVSNFAHQSKGAATDRLDLLLNQWGIYHLHLSDHIEPNGFCSRTGPVLFCFFDQHSVYFLDILEHGTAHRTVWVNEDILRIIKTNWPRILDQYKLNGVSGDSRNLTPEEKLLLRKKHGNSNLEIDGDCYVSPGFGLLGSGTSLRYAMKSNKIIEHMAKVFEICKKDGDYHLDNGKMLRDIFPKKDRYAKRPATFRLKKEGTFLVLYEQRTNGILQAYDMFFPIG